MENEIGNYYGIKTQYAVMVERYSVTVSRSERIGGYRTTSMVVGMDVSIVYNEVFETQEAALQAAAQVLEQKPTREGYTEVRRWFEDGGITYAANYPGKDVIGVRFAKGAQIMRKQHQNLAI